MFVILRGSQALAPQDDGSEHAASSREPHQALTAPNDCGQQQIIAISAEVGRGTAQFCCRFAARVLSRAHDNQRRRFDVSAIAAANSLQERQIESGAGN
jgi:hypothetical protein